MRRNAVGRVLKPGLRAWRSVAGTNTRVERVLRQAYAGRQAPGRKEEGADYVQYSGDNYVYAESKSRPGPRVGILLRGGCDLPTAFVAAPLLREGLIGSFCIYKQGRGISDARPDLLLQTLADIPEERLRDVVRQGNVLKEIASIPSGTPYLGLPIEYFRPHLFDRTFTVPALRHLGEFPKTVVVLSIGPAVARTVYRHRQHGYLVDPGGFWLNESMDKVLADLATANWFKENFQSLGRMTPESFHDSFGEVVRAVREKTGAHVLVYNLLVVDPGDATHNYQFIRNAQSVRRRRFDLALRDLSRELDFHIVDIDRILKLGGVHDQFDFSHFPMEHMPPVARELKRILSELSVI